MVGTVPENNPRTKKKTKAPTMKVGAWRDIERHASSTDSVPTDQHLHVPSVQNVHTSKEGC